MSDGSNLPRVDLVMAWTVPPEECAYVRMAHPCTCAACPSKNTAKAPRSSLADRFNGLRRSCGERTISALRRTPTSRAELPILRHSRKGNPLRAQQS